MEKRERNGRDLEMNGGLMNTQKKTLEPLWTGEFILLLATCNIHVRIDIYVHSDVAALRAKHRTFPIPR